MTMEDLNLPSPTQLADLQDRLLRFFDDDEHIMGEECPCSPQIMESPKSKSGLILVHNKYNLVPRCSLP